MFSKAEFRFLPTAVRGKMARYATKYHTKIINDGIRRNTRHMWLLILRSLSPRALHLETNQECL